MIKPILQLSNPQIIPKQMIKSVTLLGKVLNLMHVSLNHFSRKLRFSTEDS